MRAALTLLVGAVACQSARANRAHPATFEQLRVERLRPQSVAFETNSGLGDSLHLIVRDTTSWRQIWQRIHQPFIPQPALPAIDFGRDMVVVAAMGTRPSGGYDVIIERAGEDSAGVEVFVRQSSPAAGCPLSAALTQPVDVAKIPARPSPVHFRERRIVVPCGGP
jgi:protease stability complex PrcB-like protein